MPQRPSAGLCHAGERPIRWAAREDVLQDTDPLQTIAEIAIALAGFTGVVAYLGERARGEWRAVDLFRFKNLLTCSIAALLLSFAPILIHKLGALESTAWRWSSGMTAAILVVVFARVRAIRQLPEVEQGEISRPALGALGASLAATLDGRCVLR